MGDTCWCGGQHLDRTAPPSVDTHRARTKAKHRLKRRSARSCCGGRVAGCSTAPPRRPLTPPYPKRGAYRCFCMRSRTQMAGDTRGALQMDLQPTLLLCNLYLSLWLGAFSRLFSVASREDVITALDQSRWLRARSLPLSKLLKRIAACNFGIGCEMLSIVLILWWDVCSRAGLSLVVSSYPFMVKRCFDHSQKAPIA